MKTSELREKSVDELSKELESLLREGFNLRMQRASGQLAQVHQIKQNRRAIARVKTVMKQKSGE